MKTIIEKIQLDNNNSIIYIPVGYTENIDLIAEINIKYDETLGKFNGENRTKLEIGIIHISKFFENIEYTFEARQTTDSDLNELTEITNFNQL
jgi:hypothetical protein